VPAAGGAARIEIFEPEAEIVRWIFHAYVETGRSIRQIAMDLLDRGIASPTGNRTWGTSTITRLLNNEAYIGTVYYNRRESLEGNGPRGARNHKTRNRERPREEWIPIPVPAIIDRDTFDRVKQIKRDNSKWNPRGAEWGVWLLRGLIECGHCHLGCNCHRMRGRNGTWHRYYYCRGHDVLRAHSPEGRCPERNIRADELDNYVWAQVRQALLDPRQLIAGERAVIAGTPADENELVTVQLKQLDTALDGNEREHTRLLDAYQAGLLELDELTTRTATLTARRDQLAQEKTTLTKRSAELATENRLRRRLAGFAEQIAGSLDDLDIDGRRRLLRLVIEKIRVTGWRVEIHLKIPLPDNPPDDDPPPPGPEPDNGPSSDMRLRSLGVQHGRVMQQAVEDRGGDGGVFEDLAPLRDPAVGGQDHGAVLVATRDHLEEVAGGLAGHRQIAKLVNHKDGWSVPEPHRGLPAAFDRGARGACDEVGGGGVVDAVAGLHGFETDCCGQHRLPDAGRADQQHVGLLLDEPQGGELVDEPAVQSGLCVVVELLERLVLWEAREPQAPVEPALLGRCDLDRQQLVQEAGVGQLVGLGVLERGGKLLGDRSELEVGELLAQLLVDVVGHR
jgi:hypothetical protein